MKQKPKVVDRGTGFSLWVERTFARRKQSDKKLGILDYLVGITMTIWLFFAAFLTSVGNTLAFVTLIIFSERLAYKAMTYTSAPFFYMQAWLMEHHCGMKPVFYGDVIPERENAFVFGNHQWVLDWGVVGAIAARKGRAGNMKIFAKNFVKYIPFFGWGLWMLGGIFVTRNWDKDKVSITKTFSRLKRHSNEPMWVVTWPEGTRMTDVKSMECKKFAEEKNLPVLQYCLYPRPRGFVATIQSLRDILPYVYDITTAYECAPPSILDIAVGGYNHNVHLHVKRIKMEDLPTDPEDLKNWLFDRFIERDKLLDYFHQHGCFPGQVNPEPLKWLFPEY